MINERGADLLAVSDTVYSNNTDYFMILVDVHCRTKARRQATCLWSDKVAEFDNTTDL